MCLSLLHLVCDVIWGLQITLSDVSKHMPVTTPASARIIFIPLVTFFVQKHDMCSLHHVKKLVHQMCPGCPYIINFISNTIADVVTRSSDSGQYKAVACRPFSSKRTVRREQHHSCCATRKVVTSVGCFRVIGMWRIFPAILREFSFQL